MPHYRAANKSTGETVEYDADTPQPEHLGEGWTVESIVQVDPEPGDSSPPPITPTRITKLAFRNRFTQAEKVGVEIASLDDPSAPMQQRAMAAALRANQQDIAVAQFVDLNYAATRAGVQALESVGLLGAGRALEILDTTPRVDEAWNG